MRKIMQHLHRSSSLRPGLGTFAAVESEATTSGTAQLGISRAFDALAQVEALMHPTRRGSDLAAIRASPQGAPVSIHPWTWEVLERCQHLNRASHGIFDPCLPESPGRISDLELRKPRQVVPHAALCIDLGGIAKGYAVDRALDALRASGCCGGLVNAGGDMAVFGASTHTVVCRDHLGAQALVTLKDAALATSDAQQESRCAEHRGYYHGTHHTVVLSGKISIVAPTATIADALTKCILMGDRQLSDGLLDVFSAQRIDY